MNFFEANFRARMILGSVHRHLAQQFVAYPLGDSAKATYRSEPGKQAFLLVGNLLSVLELEFKVAQKKSLSRKAPRSAA